jgi:hypothetical protein
MATEITDTQIAMEKSLVKIGQVKLHHFPLSSLFVGAILTYSSANRFDLIFNHIALKFHIYFMRRTPQWIYQK